MKSLLIAALLVATPVAAQESKPIWRDLTANMTEEAVKERLGVVWKGHDTVFEKYGHKACYRMPNNVWCGALTFEGPGKTINRIEIQPRNYEGDASADGVETALMNKYGSPMSRDTREERNGVPGINVGHESRTVMQWRANGVTIRFDRQTDGPIWKLAYMVDPVGDLGL